jgi:hypothetical protein
MNTCAEPRRLICVNEDMNNVNENRLKEFYAGVFFVVVFVFDPLNVCCCRVGGLDFD